MTIPLSAESGTKDPLSKYGDKKSPVAPGNPVPLWSGVASGEKGDVPEEKVLKGKDGIERTSNVSVPTMTVYHAPKGARTGAAVLVCPGGGYNILASEHEGTAVCEWLSAKGVTAILLSYRVPRRKGLLGDK